jgi:hypothetical protein
MFQAKETCARRFTGKRTALPEVIGEEDEDVRPALGSERRSEQAE